MTPEEFRARVDAFKNQWRTRTDALIEKDRIERGDREYTQDEVFALPIVDLLPFSTYDAPDEASHDLDEVEVPSSADVAGQLPFRGPNSTVAPPALHVDTNLKRKLPHQAPTPTSSNTSPSTSRGQSPITAPTAVSASALANLGPIKKRKKALSTTAQAPVAPAAPAVAGTSEINRAQHNATFDMEILPDWYVKAKQPSKPGANERRTWDKLRELRELIAACQQAKTKDDKDSAMQKLYLELDTLRFTDVSAFGLKRAKLFEPEHGLPQVYDTRFSKGVSYPIYVVSDAKGLHKRWLARILDGSNMFRGIRNMVKEKDSKGQGPSIDPEYKLDWKFYGDGHLVNSDWFANQLCAVRDGAHGSAQGGISGLLGQGATSISLSGDAYKETDVSCKALWASHDNMLILARSETSSTRSGTPARCLQNQAKRRP
jgi:hypothetical protein